MRMKLFMKMTLLLLAVIMTVNIQAANVTVKSPDLKYTFSVLKSGNSWKYSVMWRGKTLVGNSDFGWKLENGDILPGNLVVAKVERKRINNVWTPVYGEADKYTDNANEILVKFAKQVNGNPVFGLRIRAYNEGVAFKYEYYQNNTLSVKGEETDFNINKASTVWVSEHAQSAIMKMPLKNLKAGVQYERPLLSMLPDSTFIAIGEAGLYDYARMKFAYNPSEVGTLKSVLSSEVVLNSDKESPWRYVMAGNKATNILQNNYLLLNLNKPNTLKDTQWIRPGKVLRDVSLTTVGAEACVDFAKRNNLQYILFDAGWYGPENDNSSDATTTTLDPKRSKGPFDIKAISEYAKKNNVGIILYVNHRALEKQDTILFPLYQSWGISGMKYGFVNVGSQQWTSWMHNSIKKAADYHLMVDVHDEYRPTGLTRTYPHFMTQEGIRGDEESTPNSMVLNTIFTRMIAGAGDQTNCYQAERVESKMGSRASQMAKMICIYSPWQFVYWYDRPKGSPIESGGAGDSDVFIKENKESEFYSKVPTVWNESRIIDGFPGEYAIIARRNNNNWYVGGLNGDKARKFVFDFNFLKKGVKYKATIYSDTVGADGKKAVKIESANVTSASRISKQVNKLNGVAMIIEQTK